MKRVIFWGTILTGAAAAYMMYRRGESVGTIVGRTVTNPIGAFTNELKTARG